MKLIALTRLPHGVPAGETFEVNAIMSRILIAAGAARAVEHDRVTPESIPKRKSTYRRRDLRAED